MNSPINNKGNVVIEKAIKTDVIAKAYETAFNIDVKKYFGGLDTIEVYKCADTGYRFYFPFTIAGDSDFYTHFQQFNWYYLPWKWEHQTCASLIQSGEKILEVGCGPGEFLKRIQKDKDVYCHGLELNESCVLNTPTLQIENCLIEEFSRSNKDKFDVVCSFQVLEHIAAVNSFLKGQIDCLKTEGKLVISVPNNGSVIMQSDEDLLNQPPHHMGLWNENSLQALEKYFNIRLLNFYFEPLQPYHYSWYIKLQMKKYVGNWMAEKLLKLLQLSNLIKLVNRILEKKATQIKGHTILAVYQKL